MPELDFTPLLNGRFLDWLTAGMRMSLTLTVLALVLALPLATGVALTRLAPIPPLRWLSTAFIEAVRNVPLLAHMLFWYFAVPELLPDGLKAGLYAGNVEAVERPARARRCHACGHAVVVDGPLPRIHARRTTELSELLEQESKNQSVTNSVARINLTSSPSEANAVHRSPRRRRLDHR